MKTTRTKTLIALFAIAVGLAVTADSTQAKHFGFGGKSRGGSSHRGKSNGGRSFSFGKSNRASTTQGKFSSGKFSSGNRSLNNVSNSSSRHNFSLGKLKGKIVGSIQSNHNGSSHNGSSHNHRNRLHQLIQHNQQHHKICVSNQQWHRSKPSHCHWWYDWCKPIRYCEPVHQVHCGWDYVTCDYIVGGRVVVSDARWYLGLKGLLLPNKGIGIEEVTPGSPAAFVGLQPGMVISRCNGVDMVDELAMQNVIAQSHGVLQMELVLSGDGAPATCVVVMQRVASAQF